MAVLWRISFEDAVTDGGRLVSAPIAESGGAEMVVEPFADEAPWNTTFNVAPLISEPAPGVFVASLNHGTRFRSDVDLSVPDVGSMTVVVGFPEGWNSVPSEWDYDVPIVEVANASVKAISDGGTDTLGLMTGVPDGSGRYHDTGLPYPVPEDSWHVITVTWDASVSERRWFLDGVGLDPMDDPWEAGSYLSEGLAEIYFGSYLSEHETLSGTSFPALHSIEMQDVVLSSLEVEGLHSAILGDLDDVPVPTGENVPATTLTWEPDLGHHGLTGWRLRLAVDGEVEELRLAPEVSSFDLAAHFGSDGVHGIAHLYAVNANGWSTPAEATF